MIVAEGKTTWLPRRTLLQGVFSGKVFQRTAKNSFITLFSHVVVMLVFFVQVKIIYGGMGTWAYGSLGLVTAANQAIVSIFDFRAYECLQLRLAEYWNKDAVAVRNILKLTFWLSLGSGVAGYITVWFAAPFIAKDVFHDETLTSAIVLYGATQLGLCFNSFNLAVLRFFSQFKLQAYVLISVSILRAALLAALSILTKPTLTHVIAIFVATILLEHGTLLIISLRCVRSDNLFCMAKAPFRGVLTTFRSNWRILTQTYVLSSVKLLVAQMDMFLAGYCFSLGEVGNYRLAKNIVTRISIITTAIQAAVFPEMVQLLAKSIRQARSFILKLNLLVSLVLLPMGAILFAFAPQILWLFADGQDVGPAELMIRIGIFPLLLYQISGIWLHPLLVHFRRINLMSYVTVASSVLALIMFLILRGFGAVSLVLMLSTTYVVSSVCLLAVAWRIIRRQATAR